jgi:predicted GTPase
LSYGVNIGSSLFQHCEVDNHSNYVYDALQAGLLEMSGKAENDAPSMVVIMGVTGAGKSHFINRLAGKQAVEEGASLDPCKLIESLARNHTEKSNRYPELSSCARFNRPQQATAHRHTWF